MLDLRAEQNDAGQSHAELYEAVDGLKRRHDLHPCSVRPRDGLALRRDAEREVVQDLVKRFRELPAEQRRRLPALLNSLGQLEIVVGDLEEGQHDFQEVARLVSDPISQAEAYHNVYRAALERRDWNEALAALRRAAALDAGAFEPFPLGRYEPIRVLGAGGFGASFLCHDREVDRKVVVKALRPDALDRDAEAIFRECGWVRELDHPALVRVHTCGWADAEKARPYVVLEHFEGLTLTDQIARHGPLAPEEWLAIGWQVGRAVQALHDRGMLHRSLRPAAVLVRGDRADDGATHWRVKILDAGLALRRDVIHASASNPAARVQTALGRSVARTVGYAPPEVVGKPKGHVWVGPHSDVYAFGKLTAFALTGRPDPDGGDLVILPEPWKRLLDDLTGWTIRARPPHFGVVLDRLADLPGARDRVNAVEREMYDSTVADHTAALAADPADFAALVGRANAYARQGDLTAAAADYGRAIQLRPEDAALYRRRGLLHARAGAHDHAIADFSESLRREPRNLEALANRALAHAQRKEHDETIADCTEALRLNPRDEALYFNRGNAHFCKAEYDRAVADYDAAIRLDSKNARAFGNRGKAHALRGENGRAVADFDRAIHLDPSNVKAIGDRARSHTELGQMDKALADFDAAIRLAPNAALHLERGRVYLHRDDLEQALADFDEALALDPRLAEAHRERAEAHRVGRDLARAAAEMNAALALRPDWAEALIQRGKILADRGALDEAAADFTRVIGLEPDDEDAYIYRAEVHARQGDFEAAVSDYTAALRIAADDATSYGCRGEAYAALGDDDLALADFDEALRRAPEDVTARVGRAALYARRGECAKAVADYSEVILSNPISLDCYMGRGAARARLDDLDGALEDFTEAIRLDADHAPAYCSRAAVRLRRGDRDGALADYTEALRGAPDDLAAYHDRGRLYADLGDYDRAVADNLEALRRAPDDARTLNNLAWLWATHPTAERRDAAKAEEYARRACALTGDKEPAYLDTLATALAAGAKFAEAAERQRAAVGLAAEAERAEYQARLAVYEAGRSHPA